MAGRNKKQGLWVRLRRAGIETESMHTKISLMAASDLKVIGSTDTELILAPRDDGGLTEAPEYDGVLVVWTDE